MLSASQVIALALQDAKIPAFTSQAGQLLNMVLSELCETYDWEATKVFFSGNLSASVQAASPNVVQGQGPQPLPSTYLRMEPRTFVWFLNGVPYPLINFDDADFDVQVQQIGIASLPRNYITDLSKPGNPVFFVYPPTNAPYPYQGRCYVRMPDIGSGIVAATGWAAGNQAPEVSPIVPWFPNTSYLRTRVAGELMKITGDKRMNEFLGKGPEGAQGILTRILEMVDDKSARSSTIKLDKRRFGPRYSTLPDTKNIFG